MVQLASDYMSNADTRKEWSDITKYWENVVS